MLVAAGLGGCGLFNGSEPEPASPCPQVALIDGASRSVVRAPGDAENAGVRYIAALTELAGACRYDDDGALEIDLRFNVIAERGPALEGDTVTVPYFAAAVDPAQQILTKQPFEAEITFAPEGQIAGVAEDLTLRLPGIGPADGAELRLYVGFQLDPGQPQPRPPDLLR